MDDDELTEAEYEAATERGRIAAETEPRAVSAFYDREADRFVLELRKGATVSFPPKACRWLADLTPDQLATFEMLGDGYSLHWRALDLDLSVPGLVEELVGCRLEWRKM